MQSKLEGSRVGYWTDHPRPITGGIYIAYMYAFHTNKPLFLTAKEGDRIRLFMPPVFVWSAVYMCVYIYTYIQCTASVGLLGIHAIGHITTDCMWQHGAAAALLLLGYQIWEISSQWVSLTIQKEAPAFADG